ncbi:hypothetical protein H6G00_27360 [Leptolyngbya sp. FACHB-541]|uniref:hypothetical protein n=1 Tax=Leptolyngbya sp. FACHB-541 TaxID=2692810 RepID=UPI001689C1AD|nr:hypothetical protein [Leptolyngbya sp. FACHB-541]MBD2000276.1 hypothetical protein [Leptolyngbya sp. FACHB-541]
MNFQEGDQVYYKGEDPKIRRDYGKRRLTIAAVDPITTAVACTVDDGRFVVGIHPVDLELAQQASTEQV